MDDINGEFEKLNKLFESVDKEKQELIRGLLEETAFLKYTLCNMRDILSKTGMVKVSKDDQSRQKALPLANEYRRTLNIYALNIKILNSILCKYSDYGDDDPLDEWLKKRGK